MVHNVILENRGLCSVAVIAVITLSMLLTVVPFVRANPIPVPTLILQREDIGIVLRRIDNLTVDVYVKCTYPFANVGYKSVEMFFPIPREAAERKDIKILFNGNQLPWNITEKGYIIRNGEKAEFQYDTVEGIFPLIRWSIENVPDKFEIVVEYSYSIKAEQGEFRTLYAMATGRFADTYAKKCTAYVTLNMIGFRGYNATVSLTPPPSMTTGSSRFQFMVNTDAEIFNVTEESNMFNGLSRDVLISLRTNVDQKYEWRPFTPKNLKLNVDITSNGLVNVTANIMFNHGGFKIDWGQPPYFNGTSKITIDAKILEWTGPVPEVMMNMTHTYSLGSLKPGNYTFEYKANGITVKTVNFVVPDNQKGAQTNVTDLLIYMIVGLPVAAVIIFIAKKRVP